MSNKEISGIIAYSVTPFIKGAGQIDLSKLDNVIEHLLASSVDAITALGSAGECAYLDDSEWECVAVRSIDIIDKRVPTILGISELTTYKAIQKAIFAEKNGADAIMLAPLKYYDLTEDEIYSYFLSVADSISIPIMVYNNPATNGIDMSPQFISSMVKDIENISMVKDSSPNVDRIRRLQSLCGGNAKIYTGCNYLALESLGLGIAGWCTAAPNLINSVPQQIFRAVRQDDLVQASSLFLKYKTLLTFIVQKGLARTIKAGLELQGISAGIPRKPVQPLADADVETLAMLLSEIGND